MQLPVPQLGSGALAAGPVAASPGALQPAGPRSARAGRRAARPPAGVEPPPLALRARRGGRLGGLRRRREAAAAQQGNPDQPRGCPGVPPEALLAEKLVAFLAFPPPTPCGLAAGGVHTCVVKADGLALGKGVLICESLAEAEAAMVAERAAAEALRGGRAMRRERRGGGRANEARVGRRGAKKSIMETTREVERMKEAGESAVAREFVVQRAMSDSVIFLFRRGSRGRCRASWRDRAARSLDLYGLLIREQLYFVIVRNQCLVHVCPQHDAGG